MALSVTIGAVNQTAFIQEGTATLKFNTLDLTLLDPATVPALGNTVTLTDPTWTGTVTRLSRRTGPRPGYQYVTVSATNTDTAGASAGPFRLTDTPTGQSFYQAIIDSAPLAYWRLGEASGTNANDEIGTYDGTYVGTPTLGVAGLLSGDADTAVTLDGITQCITYAAPPTMTAFSAGILFRRGGAPAGTGDKTLHILMGNIMGFSGYPRLYVTESTGLPAIQWKDSGSVTRTVAGTGSVGDGNVHHLWATHDGTTGRLYVDGVQVGTPVAADLMAASTGAFTIGRGTAAGASQTNGTIDEPGILDRALSAAEIAAIYATRTAVGPVPTYGYDGLTVETSDNLDATSTTKGTCTIYQSGLWPAMTFELTCADLGYSATSFSAQDVTVTWVKGTPRYHLTFGDPLVTMSVWLNSASAGILPITTTKITDDAVTTPKIAANAVTASEIAAGAVTTAKLSVGVPVGSNLVADPGWEEGSVWTGSRSTAAPRTGTYNGVLTALATAYLTSAQFPALPSRRYNVVGWGRGHSGNTSAFNLGVGITFYDAAAAYISNTDIDLTATGQSNTYTRHAGVVAAPSTAAFATVYAVAYGSGAQAWSYWDDFECYPADNDVSAAGGDVLIVSGGATFTNGKITVQDASANTNISAGVVQRVNNSASEVVITSTGLAVTNGKITVTNAGSTVIIDGSSNHFKIANTGTLSCTVADGASGSGSATVTGVAPAGAIPMHLVQIYSGTGGQRQSGIYVHNPGFGFDAASSGGSPTAAIIDTQYLARFYVFGSGTDDLTAYLSVYNASGASRTTYCRYYILKEAGI